MFLPKLTAKNMNLLVVFILEVLLTNVDSKMKERFKTVLPL